MRPQLTSLKHHLEGLQKLALLPFEFVDFFLLCFHGCVRLGHLNVNLIAEVSGVRCKSGVKQAAQQSVAVLG